MPEIDMHSQSSISKIIKLFLIFFIEKNQFRSTYFVTYATDSTLVCPVKMEYGPENNIFVLKMMMKSGLEKIISKFLHAQAVF